MTNAAGFIIQGTTNGGTTWVRVHRHTTFGDEQRAQREIARLRQANPNAEFRIDAL